MQQIKHRDKEITISQITIAKLRYAHINRTVNRYHTYARAASLIANYTRVPIRSLSRRTTHQKRIRSLGRIHPVSGHGRSSS